MPFRTVSPLHGSRRAFTLVEMLIVVAIVAILIGLLMPAIQAARESARFGQCRNNIRQMGSACVQHEAAYGYFPLMTRLYGWTADADLGNGKVPVVTPDYPAGSVQTGSWMYNILPYMDHLKIHQYGLGTSGVTKRQWNARMAGVAIPTFHCSSRTDPRIYNNGAYVNAAGAPDWPGYVTRPDFGYSVGAGDGIGRGGQARYTYEVTDGLSNVFFVGHRYLNPLEYNGPGVSIPCNNSGWTQAVDWDHFCYTGSNNPTWGVFPSGLPPGRNFNPLRDSVNEHSCGIIPAGASFTWGYPTGTRFGSPHAQLPMAMADGSVHAIDYSIDKALFQVLGNVADGGVLTPKP